MGWRVNVSSSFEIDGATIRAAAGDVRRVGDGLSDEVTRLRAAMDELSATWQGDAASRFQELMSRWDDGAARLLGALDHIAELLDRSAEAYAGTDEQQSREIGRIGRALNP